MKKSYIIKLEGKEWENCLDKSFKKRIKDVKIDGFRKGQASKDLYIKKFGVESLYMDAIDVALPIMYDKLLDNKDTIKPVASPTIDIKNINLDALEVEFTLVSSPEVKLGNYKDLKIKKEKVEVTKAEIEHEIEHLKEQFVELRVIDKAGEVKNDHVVIIDFEGKIDGKAFDGGKAEKYSLTIGSSSFIPGFEEAVIGMKINEEKDINLKFPENYHVSELKDKAVVFRVKLHEIKERVMPEINDEFFKDLNIPEVDSLEKLENEIKENINVQKSRKVEDEHLMKCLDTVVKNSKFDVPEEMITDEVERMIKNFSNQLSMQGMNIDKYLEMTKSKIEDLKSQMAPEAKKRISYRLVIDAVVEKEKIDVTKDEIKAEIEKLSKAYNMKKEELLKNLGGEDIIKYDIKAKKAIDIITK